MNVTNLAEALLARRDSKSNGILFIEGSNSEQFLSYKELYGAALRALSALQNRGVHPKDELVFQVDDNKTFIIAFWACILGGMIPVPLSIGQNDDHRQKLFNTWAVLNHPYLLISEANLNKIGAFAVQKKCEDVYSRIRDRSIDANSLMSSESEGKIFNVQEKDIAFVQFSSGSTGSPKGVILTHKNLITNMNAISKAAHYSSDDSMLSWMPLTHDMGLIGFHLNPLLSGMNQYLIPTSLFIRTPGLWLDKASEHSVSILSSPNFGYKYFIRHSGSAGRRNWDLSHVRIIYNGAEPIAVKLCHDFLNSLSIYGLKRNSMCPVYGLAEASLAVSISGIEDEVISVHLDRNKLNNGDRVAAGAQGDHAVSFVNVGRVIDACSLRITDDRNVIVQDEIIGRVQIKGDNVTSGYYNNDAETAKVIGKDGWLDTGDLGFIRDGSLYITGRIKDVIFINGQNYYPHDIERVADEVEGVELNKIAVAGYFDNDMQKEEVIAFVFHRGNIDKFIPVARSLRELISMRTGIQLNRIIPVKDIPKTTSGKLQRFRLIEQYKQGDFNDIMLQLDQHTDEPVAGMSAARVCDNDMERRMLEIWKQVLDNKTIDIEQSFFAAGGNSLKAAELRMSLLKEFQVELPFETLQKKQTIRALADEITRLAQQKYIPIPLAEKSDYYPASSAQKRLYYLWEVDRYSIAYNIPVGFQINGEIKTDRLEACIRQLILRHDSLRMCFRMKSEPQFRISDNIDFSLECISCKKGELDKKLKDLVQPFNLTEGPLFRIKILKIDSEEYVLYVDFHHLISDGVSIYNFIGELLRIYAGEKLSAPPVQYIDYTCWEEENLKSGRISTQLEYWQQQLQGELPVLEMPADFRRPMIFSSAGERLPFELGKETTEKLKTLASAHHCSLHVLMFTIYNILLFKYTGQEDIIVGIPVRGRRHPDLQNALGMFVNNLAIRSLIKGDDFFVALLQTINNSITRALDNQDYPFETLVQVMGGKRDVSRNPVFDSMFVYQNLEAPRVKNNDFSLSRYFFDPGFSKFDISLEVFESDDLIRYEIEYSTKLFRRETILKLATHFDILIKDVLTNPNRKLSALSVLSGDEYDEYVRKFNDTKASYPKEKTIHQLFEEQVKRTPGSIAVEHARDKLTFEQLNLKADRFALLLKDKGMVRNDIAAILLRRSPELIISILGILKAGGCYLPMDVDLPGERVNFMVSNSGCRFVITGTESITDLHYYNNPDVHVINIDEIDITPAIGQPIVENVNTSTDLAYVIYTSGTTGNPKGVMIEHRSLVNYIWWAKDAYNVSEHSDFPLYTSVSFDLTATSIFTPLITGNRIVIYEEDSGYVLVEKIIAENKVDCIKLTPSHLKLITGSRIDISASKNRLRKFIVGGEQLEMALAREIYAKFHKDITIYNEYGPTEATVGCMLYTFRPDEPQIVVPIGVPANNTQVYVLDNFFEPVPAGARGELYVSGDGVARGYLFQEGLTEQKFVPDPFSGDEQRMYKTGDIAIRLPDGNLEYIGRSDQQIKINGYRIELSEIENHLKRHDLITNALVAVGEGKNGQKILSAYYTADDVIKEWTLKNYLAELLPHYMIPAHFIALESVPLTKNGKVDYNALQKYGKEIKNSADSVPKNAREAIALQIWRDVLGKEDLSTTDNFYESGGDSIKAVQIASRLFDQGIALNVKDLLTYHTIEQISSLGKFTAAGSLYEQGVVEGEKRLSPIESWFFGQHFVNPNYYNQSILLRFNRKVDVRLLQEAFKRLILQHDGLRLNYDLKRSVLFFNNRYLKENFVVEEFETNPRSAPGAALEEVCESIKRSFDISNTLLFKAAMIRDASASEMLLITAHHLVIDGVSWRILLEDLYVFYNALEKGEAPVSARKTASLLDWEKGIGDWLKSEQFKMEETYWDKADDVDVAIPQDYKTNDWSVANAGLISLSLESENTTCLLTRGYQVYKADIFTLLNTCLALALREMTGLDRFSIEQESHGRHLASVDTSRTVGWFTSIYPVKLKIKEDLTGNQIRSVKEQLRNVPYHGIGYGIRKYLRNPRNGSSGEIAEIRFNYLGQFNKELNNDLFSYSHESHGSDIDPANTMTAKLELNSMVMDGIFILEIRYNRKAYRESTIIRFRDLFLNNLEKILEQIKVEQELHFTPSDFDTVDLDQEELDTLFN